MINKSKIESFFNEINKENDKSISALLKDLMVVIDTHSEVNALNLLFAFLQPVNSLLKNNIRITENVFAEIVENKKELNEISANYKRLLSETYIKAEELEKSLLAIIYCFNKEKAIFKTKIEE